MDTVAQCHHPPTLYECQAWSRDGRLSHGCDTIDLLCVAGPAPMALDSAYVPPLTEDLTDRAAANAVRRRIDWQYALRFDLTDPSCHDAVLAKVRTRLVAGRMQQVLLDVLLAPFHKQDCLQADDHARTAAPHGRAALRAGHRLEGNGAR